jgi:hypothetical protein
MISFAAERLMEMEVGALTGAAYGEKSAERRCDQAEAKRVALVIGNAAYRTISPLANPLNDARLVANALAASGFDVQMGLDLDKKGIETVLKAFALDAMQADVATVYFAGHGLEASGANWLLPRRCRYPVGPGYCGRICPVRDGRR